MRLIGNIPRELDAERFGHYLFARGVISSIEEAGDGAWQVWVENEDRLDVGKRELELFLAHPLDERYAAVVVPPRTSANIADAADDTSGGAASDAGPVIGYAGARTRTPPREPQFRFSVPAGRHPILSLPLTWLLIIACVVVAAMTKLGADESGAAATALYFRPPPTVDEAMAAEGLPAWAAYSIIELRREGLLEPGPEPSQWRMFDAVRRGEWWRLASPALLHFSPVHIFFNLYWLLLLGRMIESRRGTLTLALVVLVGAVASNCAEAAWISLNAGPAGPVLPWLAPSELWTAFGGMSGVVYALVGYAWVRGRRRPEQGVGLSTETTTVMIVWLVLCMTGLVGNIANAAHVAGLVVGVLAGTIDLRRRRLPSA